MNELDKRLLQAVSDLRDETGRTMNVTRTYMLARIRRERMTRWGLGGGSAALLCLVLYYVFNGAEPPIPPHTGSPDVNVPADVKSPSHNLPMASAVEGPTQNDLMYRRATAESLQPGQQNESAETKRKIAFDKSLDGFIAESTKIAQQASDALDADELVVAAKTYRHLARLCEKRLEWKRALLAYESAVACATRIGDKRLLAELTRQQAAATKNSN